jgi:hypothetical protein
MTDELEGSRRSGIFTISPSKDLFGELTFSGSKTSLKLQDHDLFSTNTIHDYIVGTLHDQTKVTLINCVAPIQPDRVGTMGGKAYYTASIFPHYIVHGHHHIAPTDKVIAAVEFVIDDASTLFYDFDTFGSVFGEAATPLLNQIIDAHPRGPTIIKGTTPIVFYYTGKDEIIATDTILGRVSVSHRPSHNVGGPDDSLRIRSR